MLDQFDALVVPADRCGVIRAGRREILERMDTTDGPKRGDHVLGHLPFVEPGAALGGDPAQDLGLSRLPEQLPRAGRFAIDKVVVAGPSAQVAFMVHPVEGGARRHRNARLGVVDDGGEHGVEAELPVILRQAAERVDRTGDSDGLRRAEQRHAHVPGCPYLPPPSGPRAHGRIR
jgi:hypothetical protein